MKLVIVLIFSALNLKAQESIYSFDGNTENHLYAVTFSNKVDSVLETAMKFNGVRYKYAGADYNGMDCSGLVCTAFQSANVKLPRSSSAIAQYGEYVEADSLQSGDLMFFKGRSSSSIGHVAIVSKIKDGSIYILHATTSKGVIEEKLENNAYFLNRWLFNKRVIN